MTIEDGTYRFVASASRATVVADAPGHKFRATGDGLEGTARVEGGQVVEAEATFPLWHLDAGDMLSNREMKKFLDLPRRPSVRGKLAAPVAVEGGRGKGRVEVELQGRPTKPIDVTFDVKGMNVTLHLQASFSAFGHKPPKLLFIKVKDDFDLTLDCQIQRADA
ncbi:MAG: hypothetical protein RMA76_43900 [Deltaproteobacteria bacterium]|jgi:hypothetical protein